MAVPLPAVPLPNMAGNLYLGGIKANPLDANGTLLGLFAVNHGREGAANADGSAHIALAISCDGRTWGPFMQDAWCKWAHVIESCTTSCTTLCSLHYLGTAAELGLLITRLDHPVPVYTVRLPMSRWCSRSLEKGGSSIIVWRADLNSTCGA